MNENPNRTPEETDKTGDATIIIDEADTRTLRQIADKGTPVKKKKKLLHRKSGRRTLESINKNAKWYPLRVILFVAGKVLSYALNILLTLLLICAITGIAVACAFIIYVRNFLDLEYTGLDNLKFNSDMATQIYYIDDEGNEIELENDRLYGSENRLWVNYDDIPQRLIDAYIAIEDQRFFQHKGVDAKRTIAAVFNFFIPTSSSYGGGSTITQQLIKNVSGENQATIQRKVQEIFRALDVEEKYSKYEILEMYLNTIYLSQNTNGVRAAAETYFNKDLNELTLAECASIAAIGKSPTYYDPIRNPEHNLVRRNLVLKEMLSQGKITREEYDEAYDAPIELYSGNGVDKSENVHSYYIDTVIEDVISDLQETYGYDRTTASNLLYSGGLKIYICMDPYVQATLEEVFENDEYWPASTGVKAQGAMVVMDPDTGEILGIVGGRGEKKDARGLNRATMSTRQSGSSIKPISVYALALETGLYTYGSAIDDVPQMLVNDKNWPSNAELTYEGLVSLKTAIKKSKNTCAVATLLSLGIDTVYDHLTEDLGFTTLVDSDKTAAPLALGGFTYGVTVREMTQGYSALANEGVWSEARTYSKVLASDDSVLLENGINQKVVYSEETAYIMSRLLKSVVHESGGTAYTVISLKNQIKGLEICGKTGTTTSKRDYYFSGYTPDYVACCWYGYDNNKTINVNKNPAALLWDSVMCAVYEHLDDEGIEYELGFERPSSIIEAEYCSMSGQLVTEACLNDIGHVVFGKADCVETGYFTIDTLPSVDCPVHVEVLWDTVTQSICLGDCDCPPENLISVSFRKVSRLFRKQATIGDSGFIYMDIPLDYVFPTVGNVQYFNNLAGTFIDEEGNEKPYYFGTSGSLYNRVCLTHLHYRPDNPDTDESDDESDIYGDNGGDIPAGQ